MCLLSLYKVKIKFFCDSLVFLPDLLGNLGHAWNYVKNIDAGFDKRQPVVRMDKFSP